MHEPAAGHATDTTLANSAVCGAAPPGRGAVDAVQVPPASVSSSPGWPVVLFTYRPPAVHTPTVGQVTVSSDPVTPPDWAWPGGKGAEPAVQAPLARVSTRGWCPPVAFSYLPTAMQAPTAGHETDWRSAVCFVKLPAPVGSGASVALKLGPVSVSMRPTS